MSESPEENESELISLSNESGSAIYEEPQDQSPEFSAFGYKSSLYKNQASWINDLNEFLKKQTADLSEKWEENLLLSAHFEQLTKFISFDNQQTNKMLQDLFEKWIQKCSKELKEKNEVILQLESNLTKLKLEVENKDKLIDEQAQKLRNYELVEDDVEEADSTV